MSQDADALPAFTQYRTDSSPDGRRNMPANRLYGPVSGIKRKKKTSSSAPPVPTPRPTADAPLNDGSHWVNWCTLLVYHERGYAAKHVHAVCEDYLRMWEYDVTDHPSIFFVFNVSTSNNLVVCWCVVPNVCLSNSEKHILKPICSCLIVSAIILLFERFVVSDA